MAKTIQLLTARCGKIRPDSVADYLAHDGFSALKKAMNMSPMEIINEVIDGIKLLPLRDRLHYLVEKRFRGELAKCEGCKLCR